MTNRHDGPKDALDIIPVYGGVRALRIANPYVRSKRYVGLVLVIRDRSASYSEIKRWGCRNIAIRK